MNLHFYSYFCIIFFGFRLWSHSSFFSGFIVLYFSASLLNKSYSLLPEPLSWALLNTGTERNIPEWAGIYRNEAEWRRNEREWTRMEPEWTRMEPECTGTSRNDTEIYWNEPEWDWNEHEYGRLNLKRAKCDVLAFRFFSFFQWGQERRFTYFPWTILFHSDRFIV